MFAEQLTITFEVLVKKKYFKTKGYKSLVFFSFHEPRPSLTGILIWTMASINNVGLK